MGSDNMTKEQMTIFNKDELYCGDFMTLLGDYYDEDLPEVLYDRADSHRKCCSCCYDLFESYEKTIRIVKKYGRVEIPEDAKQRLREFIKELPSKQAV